MQLKRSEEQCEIYSNTFNDRVRLMIERNEDKAPRIPLTEREPATSGPLLAAYDAVDALEHLVELQVTMPAGAVAELEKLKELREHATSCEARVAELQTELEDAERDWGELDSRWFNANPGLSTTSSNC